MRPGSRASAKWLLQTTQYTEKDDRKEGGAGPGGPDGSCDDEGSEVAGGERPCSLGPRVPPSLCFSSATLAHHHINSPALSTSSRKPSLILDTTCHRGDSPRASHTLLPGPPSQLQD